MLARHSTQRYSTYSTIKTPGISLLGYALLGLIQQKPSSGYDLRKTFAETTMGNYSDSPGAIYPALERLADRGLIASEVKDSRGLRRRLYRLTGSGETELKKWLVRPIARDDVMRGAADLMLRFAFIERALGVEAAVAFLQSFRAELKTYLSGLNSYLRENATRMGAFGASCPGERNTRLQEPAAMDRVRRPHLLPVAITLYFTTD